MIRSTAPAAVELIDVAKTYGSVEALKGIRLTIQPGEVVAILGPNGAGKSTAILLMLGMRRATSGTVRLFGENPRLAANRKRIGVMLQETGVPGSLTVKELVELFGRFHDNPLRTKDAIARAGLADKAKTRLGRLSGGQKQRVYFALALVGNPDVLFLDEPTTGLDVDSRRHFWDEINQYIGFGKTLILTTHNLEEADALARRVIVINQGQIIADGTPDEIKSSVGGKYVSFRAEHVTEAELCALPDAQRVEVLGAQVRIFTQQPEAVLATLFQQGAQLRDLEVVGAGLEEAFLALTSAPEQAKE
jgi:ABC-2 type transport system ATP-binding protein